MRVALVTPQMLSNHTWPEATISVSTNLLIAAEVLVGPPIYSSPGLGLNAWGSARKTTQFCPQGSLRQAGETDMQTKLESVSNLGLFCSIVQRDGSSAILETCSGRTLGQSLLHLQEPMSWYHYCITYRNKS